MIKCLLFDLDGIVIDSERIRDDITTKLLKSLGHVYNRNLIKPKISGKSSVDGARILVAEYNLKQTPEELNQTRWELLKQSYREKIPFVPGFVEFYYRLMDELKVSSAVVSGCDQELFGLINKRLGITQLFNGNIYLSQGMLPKPDPSIFVYAAKSMGVKPEECSVFEDAPLGITAATRAGVEKVIVLTKTFNEKILKKELTDTKTNILFVPDYSNGSYNKILNFLVKLKD